MVGDGPGLGCHPRKDPPGVRGPRQVTAILPSDGGDVDVVLAEFGRAGIDVTALAARLQREGAASFDTSWKELLERLAAKRAALMP